jgi:hypothetical protein
MDALIDSGLGWLALITVPLLAYVIYWRAGGGQRPTARPMRPADRGEARRLFPQTVELVNRRYYITARQARLALVAVAVGSLAILLLVQLTMRVLPGDLDWAQLYEHLRKRWVERPADTALLGLTTVIVIGSLFVHVLMRQQRLVLSRDGIRYVPGGGFVRRIKPGWAAQWSEIRAATLRLSPARASVELSHLTLATDHGRHRVLPSDWIQPNQWQRPSILRQLRVLAPSEEEVVARLRSTPLLRYLADAGVQVGTESGSRAAGFDLAANPRTLGAVGLACVLGAYALIDYLLFNETYADTPLYAVNVALGAAVALAAALWLRRGKVPRLESTALALLVGVAMSLVAYPGLLRVNQLSDEQGLRSYEYVLQPDMTLRCTTSGVPDLRLGDHKYWQSFPIGSTHSFALRRGGLGFYQVDLGPYHDDLRAFYHGARR